MSTIIVYLKDMYLRRGLGWSYCSLQYLPCLTQFNIFRLSQGCSRGKVAGVTCFAGCRITSGQLCNLFISFEVFLAVLRSQITFVVSSPINRDVIYCSRLAGLDIYQTQSNPIILKSKESIFIPSLT